MGRVTISRRAGPRMACPWPSWSTRHRLRRSNPPPSTPTPPSTTPSWRSTKVSVSVCQPGFLKQSQWTHLPQPTHPLPTFYWSHWLILGFWWWTTNFRVIDSHQLFGPPTMLAAAVVDFKKQVYDSANYVQVLIEMRIEKALSWAFSRFKQVLPHISLMQTFARTSLQWSSSLLSRRVRWNGRIKSAIIATLNIFPPSPKHWNNSNQGWNSRIQHVPYFSVSNIFQWISLLNFGCWFERISSLICIYLSCWMFP